MPNVNRNGRKTCGTPFINHISSLYRQIQARGKIWLLSDRFC